MCHDGCVRSTSIFTEALQRRGRPALLATHNRGRPCSRKGPSLLALSNPQNQRIRPRMSWHINSFAITSIVCERFVSIQSLTEVFSTPEMSKGARGEHAATAVDLPARLGLLVVSWTAFTEELHTLLFCICGQGSKSGPADPGFGRLWINCHS